MAVSSQFDLKFKPALLSKEPLHYWLTCSHSY